VLPCPTAVAALQATGDGLLAEVARLRGENAGLQAELDQTLKHR
jgi:hypothetical protein